MSLVLDAVSLSLHGRVLVPPITASVEPGEVLAVMGPSGSGKSSLLAYVAGLLEPPLAGAGRVLLGGRELTTLPVERRRVALMFQDDLLFPHLDVLGNLLFAVPRGPRSTREAAARRALDDAGLAGYEHRRTHELSGGQRSRVSLLRALLAAPQALLLDEPFGKLDAALRRQMREVVWSTLAQQGLPALLVTHDPDDVPGRARTIVIGDTPA